LGVFFPFIMAVRIKICGFTRASDAEEAIDAGAHLLGFNFWSGSKRYVSPDDAASWLRALSTLAVRVGLFVNPTLEEVRRVVGQGLVDVVQLHGDETADFCGKVGALGVRVLRAVRVRDAASGDRAMEGAPGREVLIDAAVEGAFGGTGVSLNLDLASELVRRHPGRRVLLAGGLTPLNVALAVRAVRPSGVDVASGVESSPGVKDAGLMRDFCREVRVAAQGW
jgi:phosphoribosylanthranilate isomerase